MMRLLTIFISSLFFTFAALAGDGPLTEDQAKRFVASLTSVEALGDALEAEGKIENLQIDSQPKAGEAFQPYSRAVAALAKKYPADHDKLAKALKPHGFSADNWGSVGDRVMIAYLAVKMQEDDPQAMQMMDGMDASMLEMMPPEMRAQMEGVFAMMETVKNAPAEDKEAISAVKAELDAYMERDGQS